MMQEHDAAASRLTVQDLRALLDLSYLRERRLLSALTSLLKVTDGAAFSPALEPLVLPAVKEANDAIAELNRTPIRNHGMFAEHTRVCAELKGMQIVNERLRDMLSRQAGMMVRTQDETIRLRSDLTGAQKFVDVVCDAMASPEFTAHVQRAAAALVAADPCRNPAPTSAPTPEAKAGS